MVWYFYLNHQRTQKGIIHLDNLPQVGMWISNVNDSSKGPVYRIFKWNFGMEKYLKILLFTNHCLQVETGRWQGKPLGERFSTLCINCQIGQEFHYIL